MNRLNRNRIFVPLLLILLLMFLSACQSVGNIDLNKAFTTNGLIQSAEAKYTVSWDFELDEEAMKNFGSLSDDSQILEVFKKGSLDVNRIRMQDDDHISIDMNLHVATRSIPVKIYVNGKKVVMQIAGLPKLIDISDENDVSYFKIKRFGANDISDPAKRKEIEAQFAKVIFNNLPNPNKISYENIVANINGENVPLTNIKAEIHGDEIPDIVYKLIDHLLKDEDNVRKLISLLAPDNNFSEEEKKQSVEEGYQSFKEFATTMKKGIEDENYWILGYLLKKSNYANVELGIDQKNQVRKGKFDIFLKLGGFFPIRTAKINFSYDQWNINQPVQVDQPSANAQYYSKDEVSTGPNVIKMLDPNSDLYKLFVDDLKLNRIKKSYYLSSRYNENYYRGTYPVVMDGTAVIGAKSLSDAMGYTVTWNDETKEVKISSGDKYIVYQIGSKTAVSNGEKIELDVAPIMMNNASIVPIRATTDALNTDLEYDNDANTIILTKTIDGTVQI